MIILKTGANVSVTVKDSDLLDGNRRYWAFFKNGYYDPQNSFKPCFVKSGDPERRRLYDGYVDEYNGMVAEADDIFDKVKAVYERKIEAAAKDKTPQQEPQREPLPQQQGGGLGGQLETIMLEVLAKQSVDKVVEFAKPFLEEHIKETFGVLPQVIEIKSPAGQHKVTGVTHEKFEEVLTLVGADIPVFLTGAAGTGKNVLCKQVAESLGLEFYFSNAVTQEYKITGFIDANGSYHETQFYQAFTKGGLFMLDEMDASVPEVLVMLNAAIANRYFDFPTGRVEANENFRLIAAGNTFGTGADIEYTGRYQLDAASLDRFALVEIDYSPRIEEAIARGDNDLVEYIRGFRKAVNKAGIKHLATYRSIERIAKLSSVMELGEVLKICLLKSLQAEDLRIIIDSMRDEVGASNKYFMATKKMGA